MSKEAEFEQEVQEQRSHVSFGGPALRTFHTRLTDAGRQAVLDFVEEMESDNFAEDAPVPIAKGYMARDLPGGVFIVYKKVSWPSSDVRYVIAAISRCGEQLWRLSQP